MSFLFPPPTHRTPLASLGLCVLVLHCPNCGKKRKPAATLINAVPRGTEIGRVFPKLKCDVCRRKPRRVEAVCEWPAKYRGSNPPPLDLTEFLLPAMDEAA